MCPCLFVVAIKTSRRISTAVGLKSTDANIAYPLQLVVLAKLTFNSLLSRGQDGVEVVWQLMDCLKFFSWNLCRIRCSRDELHLPIPEQKLERGSGDQLCVTGSTNLQVLIWNFLIWISSLYDNMFSYAPLIFHRALLSLLMKSHKSCW